MRRCGGAGPTAATVIARSVCDEAIQLSSPDEKLDASLPLAMTVMPFSKSTPDGQITSD
jgi:hypothetical protein